MTISARRRTARYNLLNTEQRQHLGPRGEPKKAFATREGAQMFADAANHRNPGERPWEPYVCMVCLNWHNGRKRER